MPAGKVKLVSPAKIGGKRWAAGSAPTVSAATALKLARLGAIEATSDQIAELERLVAGPAAEAEAALHAVDAIAPIVELMKADAEGALKTAAGNWSVAAIGKALGRKVDPVEIETAAKLVEQTHDNGTE